MAEMLKKGDIVASNYRVVRQLGEGGFGTVFLAENLTLLEQKVVVKVLRDGERGAGAAEARMLATLQHPNVVHVHAYDEKYDCIVMQFLAGKSAYELAATLHPVTAVRLVQATALALAAVHHKGLVHRDVKLQNVMVELKGSEVASVQLIDFGIAQTIGKVSRFSAGTLEYAAPELFPISDQELAAPAHPANDIYALGVMLFELCAHRPPYVGETSAIIQQHFRGEVPSIMQTRRELFGSSASVEVASLELDSRDEKLLEQVDELVRAMLVKDVSARPDAKAVAHRLGEIEQNFSREVTQVGYRLPPEPILLTQRAKPTTTVLPKVEPAPTGPSTREALVAARGRSRMLPIALGALLVAILLLIFFTWGSQTTKTPTQLDARAPVERVDAGAAPVAVAPAPEPGAEAHPQAVVAAAPAEHSDAAEDLTPLTPVPRPATIAVRTEERTAARPKTRRGAWVRAPRGVEEQRSTNAR